MGALQRSMHAKLISFSGIDGSGKSTQIEALRAKLEINDLKVESVRFWDDIARLTHLRESTGHRVFKGDKGVGTPAVPVNRRDKNVRSWFMTLVRLLIYFIDALSVRSAVEKARRSGADLVIFDRYIYDELANLTLANPAIRAYVWFIMELVPRPDISFVLDADPVKARARKPEYPLEFLQFNRQAYLTLSDLIGRITVIAPMSVHDMRKSILIHVLRELSFEIHNIQIDEDIASAGIGATVESQAAPISFSTP